MLAFSFFKSIRGKIVFMMIVCWLVPMSTIILVSAVNLKKGVEKIITEYLRAEVHYGTQMSSERIDEVINLSRRSSYDNEIELAVEQYQKGRMSETTLIIKVNNYIVRNYYTAQELSFAAVYLECTPNLVYGNSNSKMYEEISEYAERRHNEIMSFADTLDTYIGFYADEDNVLYLVRNLMQYNEYENKRERIGTIVFKLNTDFIFGDLLTKSKLEHDLVVVLNTAVLQLSDNAEYVSADSIQKNWDNPEFANDKTYVFTQITTKDYKCVFSVGTDNKILYKEYRNMLDTIVGVVVIVLPLLAAFTIVFYRSITRPINNLIKAIKKIEDGNLGIQIQKSDSDEFEYLFNAFNSMSKQLSNLFERVYLEQLNSKDAKIMALQSQINPHFLFNTLEVMNWQARMSEDKVISQMIEALSTMLDASMNRSNKRLVALSEELTYADAYLFLMSMRFGDRMRVIKDIDPSLLSEQVPSLIIQPLLENAVKYGLDAAHGGKIELQIYKQSDLQNSNLVVKIKNTGMKLRDEDRIRIESLLSGNDSELTSLGIRNVHTRLKLIYGDSSGLQIYDENGETVAKININLTESPDAYGKYL